MAASAALTSSTVDRPPYLTISDDDDDATWFQLFDLLRMYGPPGMLDKAFGEPPVDQQCIANSGRGRFPLAPGSTTYTTVPRGDIKLMVMHQVDCFRELAARK